jgi:hypothetical protein
MSNPPTVTTGNSASNVGPANSVTKPDESPAKAQKTTAEPEETTNADTNKDKKAVAATPPTTSSDGGEDNDDDKSIKSEGADEEDALFTTLEKNEEQEEAAHPHDQPKDAKAAPMLLQSALAKGDVKMEDSNSGKEVKIEADGNNSKEEEKKGEEEAANDNAVLQRVRNKIGSRSHTRVATKSLTLRQQVTVVMERGSKNSAVFSCSHSYFETFLYFSPSAKSTRLFAFESIGIQ